MHPGPFRSAADVDGPCISVTGAGGERVYCSMQASTSGREHSARYASHHGQLTQDSIHILMEQVSIEVEAFVRLQLPLQQLLSRREMPLNVKVFSG